MKTHRPQFHLKSLFILTALVAVGCLVGPPIVRSIRERMRRAEIDAIVHRKLDEAYRASTIMTPEFENWLNSEDAQKWLDGCEQERVPLPVSPPTE
jgi:hypothetical protein